MIERFLLVSGVYHTRSRHTTISLKEKEIKYDVRVIIDKGQAGLIIVNTFVLGPSYFDQK